MNKMIFGFLVFMMIAPSVARATGMEIDENNEFFKSFKQDIADKDLLDEDLMKDLNAVSDKVKQEKSAL